jgi:hypothetical protein
VSAVKNNKESVEIMIITPEMIAAGREVLESNWVEFTGPAGFLLWDKVLPMVFRAMLEARL